jgi:hypothetical protein
MGWQHLCCIVCSSCAGVGSAAAAAPAAAPVGYRPQEQQQQQRGLIAAVTAAGAVQSLAAGSRQVEGVPADLPALPLGPVLLLLVLRSARVPLVLQLQAGQVLTPLAAKV